MIWDFRGTAALQTATHHEIHLKEYIVAEKVPAIVTNTEVLSEMHVIAYLVIPETHMIAIRDALKPHRAEVYNK